MSVMEEVSVSAGGRNALKIPKMILEGNPLHGQKVNINLPLKFKPIPNTITKVIVNYLDV